AVGLEVAPVASGGAVEGLERAGVAEQELLHVHNRQAVDRQPLPPADQGLLLAGILRVAGPGRAEEGGPGVVEGGVARGAVAELREQLVPQGRERGRGRADRQAGDVERQFRGRGGRRDLRAVLRQRRLLGRDDEGGQG